MAEHALEGPAAGQDQRPEGDEGVGRRHPPGGRPPGRGSDARPRAARAKRTADHAAPPKTTRAPSPLPTPARTRGNTPKTSLPTGMVAEPATSPETGAVSITPTASPESEDEDGPHPSPDPLAAEEIDRAQRQPRDVEHRARAGRRPGTHPGPTRSRRRWPGRPRRRRTAPAPPSRPPRGVGALAPALERRLGEERGDRGGDKGETCDHSASHDIGDASKLRGRAPPAIPAMLLLRHRARRAGRVQAGERGRRHIPDCTVPANVPRVRCWSRASPSTPGRCRRKSGSRSSGTSTTAGWSTPSRPTTSPSTRAGCRPGSFQRTFSASRDRQLPLRGPLPDARHGAWSPADGSLRI